jgi:hypothetical protein
MPYFRKLLPEFPGIDPTKGVRDVSKMLQQSLEILWANRLYARARAWQASTSRALDEPCIHESLEKARSSLKERQRREIKRA